MSAGPPRETGKARRLNVAVLPARDALFKLDALVPAPERGLRGPFGAITRTESERCVICPERDVPPTAVPVARAGIPIFPVTASASGFVFVREEHLSRAIETAARWGPQIREIAT